MATEADTPQPVPLTETVHLTAGELNQPPEPTDYFLKSVHAHESSNLQNGAAYIDTKDDLGVSKGESFLKPSLEAEVASEDTCRKQEPFEAVKMPHEAEKHLEDNEQQIRTDENFDSAEIVSREKDATAEITDRAQNVGENSEIVDSTEIMKIVEPELSVQEKISSEEKINQQVEEIVNVNIEIEENTNDYKKDEETTKTGGYAEAETSKEVDKPEGILDQNTEVSAQTPNLTISSTDGGVQTIKEACLKDETQDCTVGTYATHIEGSVTEQSAAGAEEKQPESCSSSLNEQSSETIKLSEKESSNDSVVADSLCTHSDQTEISESKEVAEDEPGVSSVSPATYSSAIEETDLIVHETEKTTSVACTSESQEPIELSENMKNTSQIADEMQEEKVEDVPVTEMDIHMQKEDNSVSENTVKEIPEEIGASEVVEKRGKTDRSEADSVKDEIYPEQGVSDEFMKQEEGERSIEVEVSEKEISREEKNGSEDAAKESEIDLSDATTPAAAEENKVKINDHEIDLHGSSIQNDELKNEKIEKSRNLTIEGTDTTCSGEYIAAITCTEQEAVFEIQDESSKKRHGKEKSTDIDANNDDTISNKMDVPPTESTDKIESAEVEISNAAENEQLAKVQDVDGDQKESNYNRTNTEETVEKEEDFCDIQLSKLETSNEPDENRKYNSGKVTSNEVIDTAFVEENTEQSSQPGDDPQEAEPINEDTVNISQDTVEVAKVSGKEDDDKQITEESLKGLSQESVEECLDKNFQNEQKRIDISSGEVHEEAKTGKPVDDISSDTTQNDEISASTLQTYQEKEEGSLQTEEVTPSGPSTSEAKGKDIELMIKDREPENNEVLEEVKENKETESSLCRLKRTEKHEEDLQNNESVENLQEITGVVTAETEKDDSSETAGTGGDEAVESPVSDKNPPSENKNHVSDEIIKDLEAETVEKDGSDIKEDNALFEAVDEDIPDQKADTAESEVVNKDDNDLRNDKAESKLIEKDNFDQADNAEVEIFQEDTVDPKEDIATVETVEETNLQKVVGDAEVEKIEKDAPEVETVEENGLDKNAENAEVEIVGKDDLDKKDDESKVEVKEGAANKSPDNALDETIKEDDVAKIEKADSTCNEAKEDTGELEDLKEQIINDSNDSAPLECADASPLEHSQTDAKNAEDSNDKDIELSKSAGKDKNIADDANQKDEIPSTCISTSLVKEAEKSHAECETVPPSQTSPDSKEEEDVSQIEMGKDNENTVALAETNASVNEEPSKEVDDREKSQNEESTNTALQTSRVEEQENPESDNQAEAEASPAELKDEDQSYIIHNDNDVVVLEVEEEKQEEKLKDEESISMISEETMADASSKTTGELENAKTPDELGKDSEVAEEENAIPEASDHQDPVKSQNKEYIENSSREILGELETVRSGENIAQEKDQKDESPCTTPPTSSAGKGESPMHEYADVTSAEVSVDEHREKDDTPVNSGENNDCNADKREVNEETSKSEEIVEQSTEKKQMENVEETSKNEEKLEEEPPKNQPDELLEQSSNFVVVETDAVTLSERTIDTSLGEVGTIQNDEEKIEEGREEKEETGKINADQVEKAAMEEVSTEMFTSDNTGKLVARKEEETEIDILSQPAEIETSLSEALVEEKVKEQNASDTAEQAPEEENIVKDQPNEIADEKMNEDEMIISVSKQEVNEIIQTVERDDSTEKQMTEEGNAIEDKAQEPKAETDKENSEEKEIEKESSEAELKEEVEAPKSEAIITTEGSNSEEENKNESNVAELKEEVEEPKSDAIGIIEASCSEEAKGSETLETKEGSEPLPASYTDSLPEISSSKSEDKDEIIEREELNPNETDDKVQTESSSPTYEESELKLNSEETTPNYVNTEVSEEQMNEGENMDQETLEAVDQVKEDTDKLEKETNSEGGVTIKSEASSKKAVETEKSEIEQKEGDIGTKAEVDISNETVQMEERAIVFKEAISKEENSTTKAEVSSKEDTEMNSETIEPEVPISAEENSVKEVEEASSKEDMEVEKFTTDTETAILEGALTTKPEASSNEAIEGDNKEIKPEVVISKDEYSAKNNESLKEVAAGKVTVEAEIATSEAESPVATVEMSSETTIEVEKAESEPEADALKEGDSNTKAEVALNEDVEAEKEATQPEDEAEKEARQPEVVISQEVDPATEVEESSDATITKEEDSAKNAELSLKQVEAEKFTQEAETATSEAENPVAMDEVSSETAAEVEKEESEPEAAAAFKEGDSATKAEAASNEDVEAGIEAAQPEVVVSQEVDSVTQVEEICEVAISEGEDLATEVKASSEATNTIQPEVVVSQEVDSMTKIEASSEADTSGGNSARKVEASSEAVIKEEKVETRPEVAVSKGEDLATKVDACSDAAIEVEKAETEPEAAIPKEKDSATEFEAASEEDTAVQKSTTQPEVAILEVDLVTKSEIEPEGDIREERDSATKLKAASEDDVVVEKSTTEPELTISEEADLVTKVGGSTKEAELEKVDIEPEAAIFEERDSGTEFKVAAEYVEKEKSTTEPEVAIYEEVDSTTTVGQSTQEADEVEKQDIEPEAEIVIEKDSATSFEAASEDIETHKSTNKAEVAISEEVDPTIMVGGSTEEAYEVEKHDTEPEADISKEKDSATEFKAASEDVEARKSTTEPEVAISEEVNSVVKVGGSTKEADEVEKQDTEPKEAISKEKDSDTEFDAASESYEEVHKSTTEPEAAISEEVDSIITAGGYKKEADEVEKQDIEPEAATSKENNSALEFESASEEDVIAEKSTTEPEVVISEEAVISKKKDSTAEFDVAKEEDAEVQKSTTETEVSLSEEVYSDTNVGDSTKEDNKVEKRDIKPEAAMSIEKVSVTECDAASEEDAELQKLTIITEVAISEEVDSVTKVERSINEVDEVEKSDTCGEKDSDVEASLTKAAEVAKADICEDIKVEASINEAVEVEKVAAEPEASVHKEEDSDAKVEMTNDNADEKKEAAELAAAVQRDLVTEAELSKEAVEVEKEATKAEEAISDAVVSDRNLEDRSVEAVGDDEAPTELDSSVPEVESQANKIHETPTDSNVESTEPGKKVDCGSEIGRSGQGDEMVSETTKSNTENRNDALDHSSKSTEKKSLHESQDIQLDIEEKAEATVEEEAPKTDDTIEVATLSTEVHGDAEKNDAKELHIVSVQEERINDMNVSCSESTESLNATESDGNEVQKIAETSLEEAQVNDKQVQVPNVPSNSCSHGTEIEGSERNIAVETIESQVLSSDLASKASKVVADENVMEVKPQDENADIVEESRKESETVAESKHEELYSAETEAKIEATVEETTEKEHGTAENTEVDETKENKLDSGETGEKTKEVSQETLVSQDESTVMENDIPIVKTIPEEEVKKEKCETQENIEVTEKETPENVEVAESKPDSDIVEESKKQELCSAETGEADDVTKSIFKNQTEEVVIEKEIIVLQANSEEETKEQQETASPVLPSKEEACETKAAEEIEQNKREILSKADETPESSSEQKTTEEVNLQQEEPKEIEVSKLEPEIKSGEEYTKYEKCEKKEQSLGEMKDEIKQSFVGVEPATEVLAASDQTLTEKASEAQNKPSPEELVLEEQEHGTWTVIEKKEQSIDETEVLKHIAKETEESCFDKEESKKAEVGTKEATETQAGAVQIVNEGPESTYYDFRETKETKDNQLSFVPNEERKGQDEMAVINKDIQMDSPNKNVEEKIKEEGLAIDENLAEKTAVSDKILDCGTDTCEESVTFGSESRSHEGLVESEAEADPKFPEAALTASITEENLCKKTFEETESIPNEVKKEQIELEKEGAKDCLSISHDEETTKEKHLEFKLKAEDSNVNEKEKNIEEVHVEEKETDARKTIVDQINNEKRTVEQPRQLIAEDVMEKIIEKEMREVKPPLEEVKSGELSKEAPTGITRVTNQEEYFNATPENQITSDAETEKTTEVTTTDKCVETTEKIKAIAESTVSAKISLFEKMQRSTREKQATSQECEPKDEAKAETDERTKSDEHKDDEEDEEEHKKNDSGFDAPVMVEASKDIDVKVPHKKSHNILSGVGSKVKHSISKVKKAITGKSSHPKQNSPKSGTKEQVNPGY